MQAGQSVGLLTLIQQDPQRKYHWICACTCGNSKSIRDSSIKSGSTLSCGCHKLRELSKRKTHGLSNSSTYRLWQGMLYRTRHNLKDYENINVCLRWHKFENFIADMGPRPAGRNISIGRHSNSADYSPSNCQWENATQQANNRSSNVMIVSEQFGSKSLTEWASILRDHTRDTKPWTPRLLTTTLKVMDLDQILSVLKITSLDCADDAIEQSGELIAA